MSYDLYLYKHKDSKLTEEHVAEYLNSNLAHNISEHPKQWNYENPATGVYFLIDWNEPEDNPDNIAIFDSFQDFKYLNFSISINFFRPRFFGVEIFPVIEKIVSDLSLYLLNPQDENDPDNPGKYLASFLQQQWISQNDALTLEHYEELGFNYLPIEKSNYLWWFHSHKEYLENNLTEDVFVPGFFVLKNKENKLLYTACVWPNHIPIILPPVDYLIIYKETKRLFKKVEETGLISYNEIINQFGHLFEKYESDVPDLKIIRQANADKIKGEFNSLKLGKTASEFGTAVAFDSFVNVRPVAL